MSRLRACVLFSVVASLGVAACSTSEGDPTSDGGTVVLPDGAVVDRDGALVDAGKNPDPDADIPFDPDSGEVDSGGACAPDDPTAVARVDGYMDKLQNPPPAGAVRDEAAAAIVKACEVFGPSPSANAGFKKEHCYAHLVASISKESGYNAKVTVKDGYATRSVGGMTANDPVVGLLQIRFSSTVHEMVALGALDRLACVGCPIPASVTQHASEAGNSAFWAVSGPSQNMSLMQNVACNVGMGAWYYYVASQGNGKASAVTYPDQYCGGAGTGGNVITGLLSHLNGFEGGRGLVANQAALSALQGTNPGGYGYVTEIKTSFDAMIGPVSGTHPFFLKLAPEPSRHCK
jgi:hypothetical protein